MEATDWKAQGVESMEPCIVTKAENSAAPTDRDETPAEFFARISNPPTPHFDKLREFAKSWKLSDEFIEDERKFEAKTDAYWAARAADGGEE